MLVYVLVSNLLSYVSVCLVFARCWK